MTACTEKEAAEKWCPHYRGSDASVGEVRLAQGNQEARCIGSRCMQWRWSSPHGHIFGEGRSGYCGLAGEP